MPVIVSCRFFPHIDQLPNIPPMRKYTTSKEVQILMKLCQTALGMVA